MDKLLLVGSKEDIATINRELMNKEKENSNIQVHDGACDIE